MFECPRCHTPVPRWKSAMMTNFTKIKCENCGARLKPDKAALQKIAIVGFVIGYPLARIALQAVGIWGILLVLSVGFGLACVATVYMTEFEAIDN